MDDVLTGDVTPPTDNPPADNPPADNPPADNPPSHAPEWLSGIEGIDAEIAGDPSLQPIKDVPNLVKSFVNAQKMLGKDKTVIPSKDSSAEEWQGFWQKVGKPESLDKYELSVEEDVAKGYGDEFIDGFKEAAFEANLLPDQAKTVLEWVAKKEAAMDEQFIKEATQKKQEAFDGLKKEWGDSWDYNVKMAKTAMEEYGGEDFTNWVKQSGLGGDPTMIKFLRSVGKSLIEEDNPGTGKSRDQFNMTPDEAQKLINEAMSDSNDPYLNAQHADHKRRVEEINKLFKIAHGA